MDLHIIESKLQRVSELQQTLADIHPVLSRVHPIAVVENNLFHIFDIENRDVGRWAFVKRAPTPMPVPRGVRAAFPLACYDSKSACVVTEEVFDSLEGYVTLFHEFVHCYQSETCESTLKKRLRIAQNAEAAGDPMWEITYPFPYDDPSFVEAYGQFLGASAERDSNRVNRSRSALQKALDPEDVEYMVWQEWKEGFARFIENQIRSKLDLEGNHGGERPPYTRVSFYEGGARYIGFLATQRRCITSDLEVLFTSMAREGFHKQVG
jgi:hypothetical protein